MTIGLILNAITIHKYLDQFTSFQFMIRGTTLHAPDINSLTNVTIGTKLTVEHLK